MSNFTRKGLLAALKCLQRDLEDLLAEEATLLAQIEEINNKIKHE